MLIYSDERKAGKRKKKIQLRNVSETVETDSLADGGHLPITPPANKNLGNASTRSYELEKSCPLSAYKAPFHGALVY